MLEQVVHNKSLMFADKSASYDTAVLGTLRLSPDGAVLEKLDRDYSAMADMFMAAPPKFDALMKGLAAIEAAINGR